MTEEEKKAIELIGWLNLNGSYIITSKQSNEQDVHKAIYIILNLIEKLQKENEGTNEVNNYLSSRLEKVVNEYVEYKENCIPKDKIREKIKELEEEAEICRKEGCENTEDFDNCCVEILKELLEEGK